MKKYYFILLVMIAMAESLLASNSVRTIWFTNGTCSHYPNITDFIGDNISRYFCIIGCEIADSTEQMQIKADIQNAIERAYPDRPELKGHMPYFHYIYTIEGHENLVFFGIPSPVDVHSGLHVVLNQSLNKYYVLPRISVADLDTLLSTEAFNLYADGWVLQYCVLLSSLKHPCCPVRMIGSNGELQLLATLENAGYDLGPAQKFNNITIDMPQISRDGDLITIIYYIAVGDVIQKVAVKLNGSRVLDYQESEVAKVPGLFGPMSY